MNGQRSPRYGAAPRPEADGVEQREHHRVQVVASPVLQNGRVAQLVDVVAESKGKVDRNTVDQLVQPDRRPTIGATHSDLVNEKPLAGPPSLQTLTAAEQGESAIVTDLVLLSLQELAGRLATNDSVAMHRDPRNRLSTASRMLRSSGNDRDVSVGLRRCCDPENHACTRPARPCGTPDLHPTWRYEPSSGNIRWTRHRP